jgi:hypothetical protein
MDYWIGSLVQMKLMMPWRLFCRYKTLLCSVSVAAGFHLLHVIPGFFMENSEENTIDKYAYSLFVTIIQVYLSRFQFQAIN